MKTKTIQELKNEGYKVVVDHWRYYKSPSRHTLHLTPRWEIQNSEHIWCKGGRTLVQITDTDGEMATGEAICHVKDAFNRKLAVRIALGRALKQLRKLQNF